MKLLQRAIAVLFLAIGAGLVYIVIDVAGSEGGAKPAVAVAYIVGAVLLAWAAVVLWRRGGNTPAPQA